MDALRTHVFVLFVLLVPVSCEEVVFTEPLTCFLLDGILIIFCIIATVLYFREKLSSTPSVALEVSSTQAEERDQDPFESFTLSATAPPSSPR